MTTVGNLANAASVQSASLHSVAHWLRLCQNAERDTRSCLLSLSRSADQGGRSGDPFEIAAPRSSEYLQARSGVYFSPALNRKISWVEDDPKKTVIRLKTGLECFTYSAHATLMHELGDKGIQSFVRYSVDDRLATAVKSGKTWIAGRPAILFEKKGGGLQGAYIHDQESNAGIWAACHTPASSHALGKLHPAVEDFISMISGSSRFYY